MKRTLLSSCLLVACHTSQSTAVPLSEGLWIEPVAVLLENGQAALGGRLTNRGDEAIAVCWNPVVEDAADAISGQWLIMTGPVSHSSSHPVPVAEEICPLWEASLLQPDATTTLVNTVDALGTRCLNLTLRVRYWTLPDRHPVDVTPHFAFVGLQAAEKLTGRGQAVSAICP